MTNKQKEMKVYEVRISSRRKVAGIKPEVENMVLFAKSKANAKEQAIDIINSYANDYYKSKPTNDYYKNFIIQVD